MEHLSSESDSEKNHPFRHLLLHHELESSQDKN